MQGIQHTVWHIKHLMNSGGGGGGFEGGTDSCLVIVNIKVYTQVQAGPVICN